MERATNNIQSALDAVIGTKSNVEVLIATVSGIIISFIVSQFYSDNIESLMPGAQVSFLSAVLCAWSSLICLVFAYLTSKRHNLIKKCLLALRDNGYDCFALKIYDECFLKKSLFYYIVIFLGSILSIISLYFLYNCHVIVKRDRIRVIVYIMALEDLMVVISWLYFFVNRLIHHCRVSSIDQGCEFYDFNRKDEIAYLVKVSRH